MIRIHWARIPTLPKILSDDDIKQASRNNERKEAHFCWRNLSFFSTVHGAFISGLEASNFIKLVSFYNQLKEGSGMFNIFTS